MSEPLEPVPAGEADTVPSEHAGASRQADRTQMEFLSRVSHELRTPLNELLGFAQILWLDRSEPLTPVQKERVDHIQTAGWRLLELLNEMLDLSRIEAGHLKVSMAPVALNGIIEEALKRVEHEAAARHVQLQREASPEATVWGNATRVKQVLVNLLSNAIKCNRAGSRVDVRVQRHGARVAVSIRNAQPTTIQDRGIDLTIARKLLELMGGGLHERNEAGSGSGFEVLLQLHGPSAGPSPLSASLAGTA